MIRISSTFLLIILFTSNIAFTQNNPTKKEIWGYNTLAGNKGGGSIFKVNPENKEIEMIHRFSHGLKFDSPPSNGKLFKHSSGVFYALSDFHNLEYQQLFCYNPSTNEIDYLIILSNKYRIVTIEEENIYLISTDSHETSICSYHIENNTIEELFAIETTEGNQLQGEWLKQSENIYLTNAKLGGDHSSGAILKIDLLNNTSTILIHFNEDKYPIGNLIKHSNNKIYGTLHRTSNKGLGGIFEFNPENNTYNVVFEFNDITGGYPKGSIFEANDQCIYGVTGLRGNYNDGCIYKYNPANNTVDSIYNINDESEDFLNLEILNGFNQIGNNNLLYGILEVQEGKDGFGKLFKLNPNNKKFTIIHQFDESYEHPVGALINYQGEFLGLVQTDSTYMTGGIFSFDPDNEESGFNKPLFNSTFAEEGQNPVFLYQAMNQHLYGLTAYGGKNNKGIVFMIDNITHKFSKLYDLADFKQTIFPYAEGFEIEPGKIIGISGPQYYGFNNKKEDRYYTRYIFEYDYLKNTLTNKITIPDSVNYGIYGPRINSKGEIYFSLGSILYEYDYHNNLLNQISINVNNMRDIIEYKEDLYYGTMRGSSPEYNMIFSWNKNTDKVSEMFSKRVFGGTPNKISPIGKIYISNDTLYGTAGYSTSGGAFAGNSYMYDIRNDSVISTNGFLNKWFDNHLRRSMIESQDKKYFIQNSTYWNHELSIEIYQKNQDSTYTIHHEEPNVEFSYSLQYGWTSVPDFDFTLRVDLIEVNPPRDLIYWVGNIDTNWHEPENWYQSKTPNGETEIIILPNRLHYPEINTVLNTASLEIQKGAQITLKPMARLSSEKIKNDGEFIIQSNEDYKSSLLTQESFENTGEIVYQYFGNEGEEIINGSPVVCNFPSNSFTKRYNGEDWTTIEDSIVEVSAFDAFMYKLDTTAILELRGEENWKNLSLQTEVSGFYPFSNPYPSSIDWQSVELSQVQNKVIYKWNKSDSSVSAYIDGLGNASPLLQPAEVFWIDWDQNDLLSLNQSNRLHADDFIANDPKNQLQISVSDPIKNNTTSISFNTNAKAEYESDKDALFPILKEVISPQIFTKASDKKLMINQLSDTSTLALFVNHSKDETLKISMAKNHGFDFVFLEDLIWNKRVNLLEEDYTFDYFESDGDYPFKLYFESWAIEPINELDIDLYYYPETLVVRSRKQIEYADIIIYDLSGKISLQFEEKDFHYFEKPIQLPTGHYIAQFRCQDIVINKKILVRH